MRPRRLLSALAVTATVVVAALSAAPVAQARPGSPPATAPDAAPAPVAGATTAQFRDDFVRREGSRLTVAGHEFRFSGGNVEWLGLQNYGPEPSPGAPADNARYPTKDEVDDVFATAREMGATAIRSQTLGDTVGCAKCLEPELGQFNPDAFAHMDMVVAEARAYGIKLIGEFEGDANGAPAPDQNSVANQSHDWYCTWRHRPDCGRAFFTDPDIIDDYTRHMRTVLEHVNPRTGLAYADDPTFLGWTDGNNLGLFDGVPNPVMENWLRTVSDRFEAVDPDQLFINISLGGGDGFITPDALQIPGVDIYAAEYYPHWLPLISGGNRVDGNAPTLHDEAAQAAAAGKAFSVIEFGWDHTDFLTADALEDFLAGLDSDPNIAGDNFWALLGHAEGPGWQPIPDNGRCDPTCEWGEDGNWWALYYTGRDTATTTAPDMAARAQLLRAHGYRMAGYPAPPAHRPVPAPAVTSTDEGTVRFRGAAGSPTYTVQKLTAQGDWTTVCDDCVTDASPAWHDPEAAAFDCYRVFGRNLDGVAGPASVPAGECGRPGRTTG